MQEERASSGVVIGLSLFDDIAFASCIAVLECNQVMQSCAEATLSLSEQRETFQASLPLREANRRSP